MTRLKLCVLVLLIVLILPVSAQSKSPSETKGSMVELCYKLWKRTNFGWNEKQTERAAWVLRDSDGRFQWQVWPDWEEHNTVRWVGAIPDGVVAQVHTHPNYGKPEPSKQDALVARQINVPVYTISGSGIWRVGANGKITKEADANWYKRLRKTE